MADVFDSNKRSEIMRAIHGANTGPEMIVRRLVHGHGYRYCLHVRNLPGVPDLVFPSRHKVILVHGCFWHRHSCRKGLSKPSTRRAFWQNKLDGNRQRDIHTRRSLKMLGWDVLVIWECQVGDLTKLRRQIVAFLGP